MKLFLKNLNQFFCLLLLVHLLAINVRDQYYLSFTNCTNVSKDFDLDEESKTNSKSSENNSPDDSIDVFVEDLYKNNKSKILLILGFNIKKNGFQYLINAFPKVHYEIQSPPPRA